MAEPDLSLAPAMVASPAGWLNAVMMEFDAFLKDHASCEKKASGMAMAVASHYPDQPELLNAMVNLAVEELNHYREVIRILLDHKIVPGPDSKDPYINDLNRHIRRGPAHFLLDRLLVAALVERRGAERFMLVAKGLRTWDSNPYKNLAPFYEAIAASEHRHWELFYRLAWQHCPRDEIVPRFAELCAVETDIMLQQPHRAALH